MMVPLWIAEVATVVANRALDLLIARFIACLVFRLDALRSKFLAQLVGIVPRLRRHLQVVRCAVAHDRLNFHSLGDARLRSGVAILPAAHLETLRLAP